MPQSPTTGGNLIVTAQRATLAIAEGTMARSFEVPAVQPHRSIRWALAPRSQSAPLGSECTVRSVSRGGGSFRTPAIRGYL
jgi:hypothetical protein